MVTTVDVGGKVQDLGDDPSDKFHGTDFESLLESIDCGQKFTDLDSNARAHALGLLQGLELARTGRLAKWDLVAPFLEL